MALWPFKPQQEVVLSSSGGEGREGEERRGEEEEGRFVRHTDAK